MKIISNVNQIRIFEYISTFFCFQDTLVIINLYSANTDPKIWDDPKKFEPRRFLDSNGELLKKDQSLPFGLGQYSMQLYMLKH